MCNCLLRASSTLPLAIAKLTARAERDAHSVGDLVDAVLQPRAGLVVEDDRLRVCCLRHLYESIWRRLAQTMPSLSNPPDAGRSLPDRDYVGAA